MMPRAFVVALCFSLLGCSSPPLETSVSTALPIYEDVAYAQDYSIQYMLAGKPAVLQKVCADRNGNVQVLSHNGLLRPFNGKLLVPGTLVPETSYRPLKDKSIKGLTTFDRQFVYFDDHAVLANAWAGTVYCTYTMPHPKFFAAGATFDFLLSDGRSLQYVKDNEVLWEDITSDVLLDIQYDPSRQQFWILGKKSVLVFSPEKKTLVRAFSGEGFTCFTRTQQNTIVVGTSNGYGTWDADAHTQTDSLHRALPALTLTVVKEINNHLWFGSTQGAFMLRDDGKFNYYASRRWLPDNTVKDIAVNGNDVLVLTATGLACIRFENMTLHDKANFYEAQVRQRHIRYGFNCDMTNLKDGNISTAQVSYHDSDNLWTAMYMASQLFRHKVTHEPEALQNCVEAFEAMERLHTLAPVKGLFGRTFERPGIAIIREEYRENILDYWYPDYARVPSSWQHVSPEWDWRGSASSDQTVGQYFALTMMAEYIDDPALKQRAVHLIDQMSAYILNNDLTLVDYDGRPTLWGRWDPAYINRFPEMVGDRRLGSSNIIAFLQTAYHFTKKPEYKKKVEELLYREGYLKNLTRPISDITHAPKDADAWSRMLSDGWNNSDDEMYFLGYWGLYPYALNDSLRTQYKEAIRDHWAFERSEKDGLWNLCYAMTGAPDFGLDETVWYLKEFPLDMIEWSQHNSHRKDIEIVPENFRSETTREILPPDERPELKHNRNLFRLDKEGSGAAEISAGDTFLLPYWMGRFLGVISAPHTANTAAIGEPI